MTCRIFELSVSADPILTSGDADNNFGYFHVFCVYTQTEFDQSDATHRLLKFDEKNILN